MHAWGELMASSISYMGTKKEFADAVADVIGRAKPGVLLDAFAGMGAVAEAVGPRRPVWTNDVQRFAHLVGQCRFTDTNEPPPPDLLRDKLTPRFEAHLAALVHASGAAIESSDAAYAADDFAHMAKSLEKAAATEVSQTAYSCFLRTYRDGYFSARQAAEIDALRFAIDASKTDGDLTESEGDWALVALGRACLKVANTPGHFAQFLRPSAANFRRVKAQGKRSVWAEWHRSLGLLAPVGTAEWRKDNRASCADSLQLLTGDAEEKENIRVVYCDPPYTDDQYSRYYHIWETLIEYDYPEVTGAGRYRPGRFATPFSLKTKAVQAFKDLIGAASRLDADLVLSYPTNGLIYECGADPLDLLREEYPRAELAAELDHHHSTFGASKGHAKSVVSERIYLARH